MVNSEREQSPSPQKEIQNSPTRSLERKEIKEFKYEIKEDKQDTQLSSGDDFDVDLDYIPPKDSFYFDEKNIYM